MKRTVTSRPWMLVLLGCLLATLLLLAGCVVARGSGNVVEQERSVSGFSRIDLRGAGELVVEQGSAEKVVVRADDNLQQHIRTEVNGDTLVISVGGEGVPVSIWPTEPVRYTVTVKELEGIELSGSTKARVEELEADRLDVGVSGSGSIRITDLDADELAYELSGSGDAVVSGKVDSQDIGISGSGSYDGADLESKSATIEISGSGSAELWVEEELDIQMSGSGSIEYYGSPKVNQDISGSGNVRALGEK